MKATQKQIKEWMDSGSDFVRGWLADGNKVEDFDGQSEAFDIAQCYTNGRMNRLAEFIGDHVYEGMVKEVEKAKAKKGPGGSS